jgi:hypothetical protein
MPVSIGRPVTAQVVKIFAMERSPPLCHSRVGRYAEQDKILHQI